MKWAEIHIYFDALIGVTRKFWLNSSVRPWIVHFRQPGVFVPSWRAFSATSYFRTFIPCNVLVNIDHVRGQAPRISVHWRFD